MSTPTAFNLPTPSASELLEALDALQKQREASTPELGCFAHFAHDYKYECEQEHQLLTTLRVDRLRHAITDPEYHEIELLFYRSTVADIIHRRLLDKHTTNGELTLDGLRAMNASYRRILAANGVAGDALRTKRLEITNQTYWKSESELLQKQASRRQQNRLAELARQHAKTKGDPESSSTPTKTRRSSRIATRTANAIPPHSKSRSNPRPVSRVTARVAKRQSKRGLKSHHHKPSNAT